MVRLILFPRCKFSGLQIFPSLRSCFLFSLLLGAHLASPLTLSAAPLPKAKATATVTRSPQAVSRHAPSLLASWLHPTFDGVLALNLRALRADLPEFKELTIMHTFLDPLRNLGLPLSSTHSIVLNFQPFQDHLKDVLGVARGPHIVDAFRKRYQGAAPRVTEHGTLLFHTEVQSQHLEVMAVGKDLLRFAYSSSGYVPSLQDPPDHRPARSLVELYPSLKEPASHASIRFTKRRTQKELREFSKVSVFRRIRKSAHAREVRGDLNLKEKTFQAELDFSVHAEIKIFIAPIIERFFYAQAKKEVKGFIRRCRQVLAGSLAESVLGKIELKTDKDMFFLKGFYPTDTLRQALPELGEILDSWGACGAPPPKQPTEKSLRIPSEQLPSIPKAPPEPISPPQNANVYESWLLQRNKTKKPNKTAPN